MQHLDDPQRALGELVRVAKPGAPVVAAEPDWQTLTLDLPNRALVRTMVQITCEHLIRNPWMGRELYRRCQHAGLVGVVAEPFGVTFTDATVVRDVLYLDAAADYGRAHALLSDAEAATWSEQIEAARASGDFFAALFGCIATGRKPGA